MSGCLIQDLGTVGRLFGALISKAGIPVPTEITQKVLTGAQHLGKPVHMGNSISKKNQDAFFITKMYFQV